MSWSAPLRSFSWRLLPSFVGILGLVLFITRRPDAWLSPQFWGEDSSVFFYQAAIHGWASWMTPYAGYLNFTSRTIACLTAGLPWEHIPTVFVLYAGTLAAYVVARVAFSSLPLLPRVLGAVALIAVPHSGEVFLNATNLNWILGGLLTVNLLESAPATRGVAARRCAEIIVAGLSGPLVLLLAPFAALWTWRERKHAHSRVLIAAWALAVGVQAAVLLGSSRTPTPVHESLLASLPWFIPQYAHSVFIGEWLPYNPTLDRIVAGVVLVAIGALALERANAYRWEAGSLVLVAALVLVAGRQAHGMWGDPFGMGARYTYFSLVLSLWALAWFIAGSRSRVARTTALALFTIPLLASASKWTASPMRQYDWPRQVREAKEGTRTKFAIPPHFTCPVPSLPRTAP